MDVVFGIEEEVGGDRDVVVEKDDEDPVDGKKDERRSADDGGRKKGADDGGESETTKILWTCNEEGGVRKSYNHGNGERNKRERKTKNEVPGRIGEACKREYDKWTVHQSHKRQKKMEFHG